MWLFTLDRNLIVLNSPLTQFWESELLILYDLSCYLHGLLMNGKVFLCKGWTLKTLETILFSKLILNFILMLNIDLSSNLLVFYLCLCFLFSSDSGRYLPSISAAGAIQLSGLFVWKNPLSFCAEAQTPQFTGEQTPPRKWRVWGSQLDCMGCLWGYVKRDFHCFINYCSERSDNHTSATDSGVDAFFRNYTNILSNFRPPPMLSFLVYCN